MPLWDSISTLFNSMTLQRKLILNIVMLALFMAVVLAVGWATSVELNRGFHQVMDGPIVMRDIMRQARGDIIDARGSHREYLLTLNPQAAAGVRRLLEEAIDKLVLLQNADEAYGHAEDTARNMAIISLLTEYSDAFEEMVKAWQIKGVKDNLGLRKELNTAIREVMDLLQSFDTSEIRTHVAELKLHGTEVKGPQSGEAIVAWRDSLEALGKSFGKSEISHFEKDKYREITANYKKSFEELLADPAMASSDTPARFMELATILDPIEQGVNQYYIRNVSYDFSMLRGYERDYIISGDAKYVKRFVSGVQRMLGNVASAATVPEKMRVAVKSNLESYRDNFLQMVEQDKKVLQLREVMNQAILKIEPVLMEHVEAAEHDALVAENESNARFGVLLSVMIGVGTLATLLAGIFNWVVAQGIRSQVGDEPVQLASKAKLVAAGDLTVDLSGGTGIRHAMENMIRSLRTSAIHGTLQSETIAAVVGQLLLVKEALTSDNIALMEKMDLALAGNHVLDQEVTLLQKELQQVVNNTQETSHTTEALSREFAVISRQVNGTGDNLREVASSSHQANASLENMRQSMTDAGSSIATVATAVEEMSANLAGVRQRCKEASNLAQGAQDDAQATASVMERLRRTTREVGKVVDLIKSIAEQTNLLALNAAIEAAGAGELGRGFAVVASEVKELAMQTREATDNIRQKVEGIRESASQATQATDRVFKGIGELTQSNEEILVAVSEQTQALDEISRSVAVVSRQTDQVVDLVNQTTGDLSEVDDKIQEISRGVHEVIRSVEQGVDGAFQVARQAKDTRERSHRMEQQADAMFQAAVSVNNAAVEAKNRVLFVQGTTVQIGQLVEVVSVISDELREAQQRFKVGELRFDVQGLKSAHLAWTMDLHQLIEGRREGLSFQDPTSCEICHLLKDKLAKQLGESPELSEVVALHDQLHQVTSKLLDLPQEGQSVTDESLDFNQVRAKLFQSLDRLYLC